MMIAANCEKVLNRVKDRLTKRFKMKDLGKLKHLLVTDFEQSDGEFKMSQERYVRKLLEKFEM